MKHRWQCPVCGIRVMVDDQHYPVHCCCGFTQQNVSMGLGDKLAVILFRVGITKAVYLRFKRRLHFKPKCGCGRRQQKLNTFGAQARSLLLWCFRR